MDEIIEKITKRVMSDNNFQKQFEAIEVNDNKLKTITNNDFNKIKEGVPFYTNALENGKSGFAMAKISRNTLARYVSDNIEYPNPVNWSATIQDSKIFQRCHTIAYNLSAKNTNYNNIFIGTEKLNKSIMKKIENKIYNDIQTNNNIYLYKVTPIYYKKDIVPVAVFIEIEDEYSGQYKSWLCYNIEDEYKINYYDGSNKPIEDVYNKREETEIQETKHRENSKYKYYDINIRTKMFHLSSRSCSAIKRVDPKYLQGTKAFEDEIIERGFKLCKKCNDYKKS